MIFVDTSFWVGIAFPRDARHASATSLLRARPDAVLVTSNHVRGETWTVLRRRAGHHVAVRALDRLDDAPRLRVESVSPNIEQEALVWLRRHDERDYSFVDATSFALMRRLAIREAFAFDGDFAAAGFVELRP
ncbi:MAG TPA: PIN domain-containing protein [Gaiellaceae bacterium]|nr:PIN domain-containing protein [Gaiellaceae bacterium]